MPDDIIRGALKKIVPPPPHSEAIPEIVQYAEKWYFPFKCFQIFDLTSGSTPSSASASK